MTQKNTLPRQFGKIILTLENCLLSDNKLQETPSQQDGLDKEVETDLRILGCELIQIAGILLKLPQVLFILFSTLTFNVPDCLPMFRNDCKRLHIITMNS